MGTPIFNPIRNYNNVPDALAPLSANTQGVVCVHDCNGNAVTVIPPYPTYSNGKGKDVVQLNMVELGGQNGLNA